MSKVVVFDVDGTLFDTKPGIIKALNEVLNNFGIEFINPSDEDKWIGPPVRNSFISYAGMNAEQAEDATRKYRKIYTEKYITESVLYDGMNEVLGKLKTAGYHLCIATMKTQGQMERLLSIKNMSNAFEIVQTAALDGAKSKADMLVLIKSKYSADSQFYMIGDTMGDYEAAKKVDYKFLAITYGYGEFLKLNSNIRRIKKSFELLKFLEE